MSSTKLSKPLILFITESRHRLFSETGRSLFADERSEAFPNRIGKETKIDTLRRNEVGAYVGGFLQAVSVV
jgi:hypothetical protein